uniref:lysozyme n=1 Tax=Bactrocera latifrons TaxID=174628 RepID=A0A0K8UMW5_BACLA
MRTVHESVFKPKLTGETKFVVNIRPIHHYGAALSSTNAAAANKNNNGSHDSLSVNIRNADVNDIPLEAGANAGVVLHTAAGDGAATQSNSKDVNLHKGISQMNWPRICTISSLIVAFLLISGSIYLHLRQKPHLGRLHHETKTQDESQGIASAGAEDNTPISKHPPVAYRLFVHEPTEFIFTKTSSATSTTFRTQAAYTRYITDACVQCICETVNLCRPAKCRDDVDCGVFRISHPYWLDAGKPTLDADNSSNSNINTSKSISNIIVIEIYSHQYRVGLLFLSFFCKWE